MKPNLEPADGHLRTLLQSARPESPLPPRFQESVWRRLDHARPPVPAAGSPLAGLDRWVERLLRPRFALASLGLLLVAGGLSGVLASSRAARQQAQQHYLAAVAPHPVR